MGEANNEGLPKEISSTAAQNHKDGAVKMWLEQWKQVVGGSPEDPRTGRAILAGTTMEIAVGFPTLILDTGLPGLRTKIYEKALKVLSSGRVTRGLPFWSAQEINIKGTVDPDHPLSFRDKAQTPEAAEKREALGKSF